MFRPSFIRFAAVAVVALSMSGPALAGGGGNPAVELAAPPPVEVQIGEEVSVGFMVLSHGSPYDDVQPYLSALHKETTESFRVDAQKDGAPGRFKVTTSFHEAGTWFWEIVLGNWGSTTLPPLTVLTATGEPAQAASLAAMASEVALPASIHRGACDGLCEIAYPLEDLGAAAKDSGPVATQAVGSARAMPAKMSVTTLDVSLAEIAAGEYAVAVALPGATGSGTLLACGEIGGVIAGGVLLFGLHGVNGSGYAGVAVLEAAGDRTTVTTYLTADLAAQPEAAVAGKSVTVEIAGFAFAPATIEIATGDTVTWTNKDTVPHTVSFADMTIADSGVLDPGETFRHTFDTSGTYTYQCNPHPNMTGTVVVT
ncbi:MAG: hypothetical protein QOJ59_3387 [Thermomicrobiales bacterium]|nr:hypothetical protein [Thermomicrobiales bacterium]